jgi:hypothetical protein
MSLYLLDAVLWVLGIRGHVPRDDDFRPGRNEALLAAGRNPLWRILTLFVVTIAFLALALWLAVWLALKLL